MALTLVAVRNDRVMVLLLSGSFFCLALEQIGCQREEQDPRYRKRWNSQGMRAGAWCEDHAHAASFYRRLRRPRCPVRKTQDNTRVQHAAALQLATRSAHRGTVRSQI